MVLLGPRLLRRGDRSRFPQNPAQQLQLTAVFEPSGPTIHGGRRVILLSCRNGVGSCFGGFNFDFIEVIANGIRPMPVRFERHAEHGVKPRPFPVSPHDLQCLYEVCNAIAVTDATLSRSQCPGGRFRLEIGLWHVCVHKAIYPFALQLPAGRKFEIQMRLQNDLHVGGGRRIREHSTFNFRINLLPFLWRQLHPPAWRARSVLI